MTKMRFIAATIALSVASLTCMAAEKTAVRVPVLLELFTSEGCSSCPPADRLLQLLDEKQPVAGADLIVLSEHVDYWDRLGWRDPFSSSLYTARQQDYANKYNLAGVYTPELVVDGRYGFVGSDAREAASAIEKAIREQKIPIAISNVSHDGNLVTAHIELAADSRLKGRRGVLYVAIADNMTESHVVRGENAGRSLAHVAVTRVLRQEGAIDLDSASAKDVRLLAQPGANGSRIVAFVQDPRSGRVIAVAAQKL
ncbi:MAG: hypothetical protein QOF72_2031 [Blastocatellia bacterium]|jgi:hypothetical protein|nr:hypothetical protein [Blastocatellia bacterium]